MKQWVAFVGYLEGFSFLTLMFYAMPLKYFAGEPEMVSLFGTLHGGLFVAYIGLLFLGVGSIGPSLPSFTDSLQQLYLQVPSSLRD